jgi:hypothetical protein
LRVCLSSMHLGIGVYVRDIVNLTKNVRQKMVKYSKTLSENEISFLSDIYIGRKLFSHELIHWMFSQHTKKIVKLLLVERKPKFNYFQEELDCILEVEKDRERGGSKKNY